MDDGRLTEPAHTTFDFYEVMSLQARYGEIIDMLVSGRGQGKSTDLRQVFLPNAVIDFPGLLGRFEGIEAIETLFGIILPAEMAWMWHAFSGPLIQIEGGTAEARWTLYSLIVRRGQEDQPPEAVYGRYVNHYVRTKLGWRQSSLLFENETRSATVSSLGVKVRNQFDEIAPEPAAEPDA